jgi:O-antigen/teichoic acid export membrane protein
MTDRTNSDEVERSLPEGSQPQASVSCDVSASAHQAPTNGVSRQSPAQVAGAVRWSAIAVVGRQASQMVFALLLAKTLGPDQFGVISVATVYATLTMLMLDQGLSSALIQRPQLGRYTAGAVATFNLAFGALLGALTLALAPSIAAFFDADQLTGLLSLLGVGLLLKAVAINPRAMLMRHLRFRVIAIADVLGGFLGAAVGISAALLGAGVWALAWQVFVTDTIIAVILLATRQGGMPNLHMRDVAELLPFSFRIFGASSLAFLARNSDNILIGRYLGVSQLSLYAVAYRVLSIPVQLVGQTVGRVAFPTMSRIASEGAPLRPAVLGISEVLAAASLPPMLFAAIAAPELVQAVLGDDWEGAVPVLTILALAGARETVLQVTQPLMRALGRGKLILRYELAATSCQLAGIIVGLNWGIVGVAAGFFIAGLLLTPIQLAIQHRLASVTLREQIAVVGPIFHAALWACVTYLAIRIAGMSAVATLLLGLLGYVTACLLVLRALHPSNWHRLARRFRLFLHGAIA